MVISCLLLRNLAQREPIQDLISQQQIPIILTLPGMEDRRSRRLDPMREFLTMPTKHQLEQFCHRLGILPDLSFGRGIENSETGIDVPFVGVYPERQVDLDVLDASDIAVDFPGELVVGSPGCSHTQEGCMGYGLGVSGDDVVLLGCEMDMFGAEARKDFLD